MKNKVRIKIIINSTITKIILIIFIISVLFTAIILPSILLASPKGSITAYNRDSSSGTREAFAEKVLGDEEFHPGKNIREVSNNDAMIRVVSKNEDSIGYVSFGTVASFDEEGNPIILPEYQDTISFVSFVGESGGEPISPTKDNINNNSYIPSRNFNMFFRVEGGSDESQILLYDWDDPDNNNDKNIPQLDDDLLISFLFMNWVMFSEVAKEHMQENGEIPSNSENWLSDDTKTMKEYLDFVDLTKDELTIEIVGSSSANSITTDLSKLFKDIMWDEFEIEIEFIISTNGSGDAFKKSIPGTMNPYIGIQSREPKDTELSSWNWSEGEIGAGYGSFAIDAILIIYNLETSDPENPFALQDALLYTDSESMLNLYTSFDFLSYSDVFEEWDGGVKNE